jgi:hypothetical protein
MVPARLLILQSNPSSQREPEFFERDTFDIGRRAIR